MLVIWVKGWKELAELVPCHQDYLVGLETMVVILYAFSLMKKKLMGHLCSLVVVEAHHCSYQVTEKLVVSIFCGFVLAQLLE